MFKNQILDLLWYVFTHQSSSDVPTSWDQCTHQLQCRHTRRPINHTPSLSRPIKWQELTKDNIHQTWAAVHLMNIAFILASKYKIPINVISNLAYLSGCVDWVSCYHGYHVQQVWGEWSGRGTHLQNVAETVKQLHIQISLHKCTQYNSTLITNHNILKTT